MSNMLDEIQCNAWARARTVTSADYRIIKFIHHFPSYVFSVPHLLSSQTNAHANLSRPLTKIEHCYLQKLLEHDSLCIFACSRMKVAGYVWCGRRSFFSSDRPPLCLAAPPPSAVRAKEISTRATKLDARGITHNFTKRPHRWEPWDDKMLTPRAPPTFATFVLTCLAKKKFVAPLCMLLSEKVSSPLSRGIRHSVAWIRVRKCLSS